MAENSKIEWCDHTFNPWMGCTAVSPACDHCYAEVQTARFKQVEWGAHAERKKTSPGNWRLPLLWNDKAEKSGVRFKVFCASLADVFDNHKSILPEWREDLWALIRATPNLDWLLLTKRPQNFAKYLPVDWGNGYPNVWLGVTAENQKEANRRIPVLLGTPAAKRFLSCEPLLGFVDLVPKKVSVAGKNIWIGCKHAAKDAARLDWVIAGGESGPHARPSHPDWFRSMRDHCQATGTPFFFKQRGEWVDRGDIPPGNRWNLDCQIISGTEQAMYRVGKKRAGRLLDGKLWNEMPASENEVA